MGGPVLFALSLASKIASADDTSVHAVTALSDARGCAPLASGDVAVATGGGLALVRADGSRRVVTALDGLPETRAHVVVEDGAGVWVGTEAGAARVDAKSGKVERVVGTKPVHAALRVASGAVYLGTWGEGVVRVGAVGAAPETLATPPGLGRVTALAEHRGDVWATFAEGAVAKLDGRTFRVEARDLASPHALASDGATLWLGAMDGTRGVGHAASASSVDARALTRSPGGWLVGTFGAGVRVGSSMGALREVPGAPRFVRGVTFAHGRYCVASTEGLHVGLASATSVASPRRIDLGTLASNDVSAIALEASRLAVGTFDAGLFTADASAPDRLARVVEIAPHETVNALAWEGRGPGAALWVATSHGVVRIAKGGARRWTAASGLPSTVARSLLVVGNGRALVGTEGGAAFVEGDHVEPVAPRDKGARPGVDSPMHATWAVAELSDHTLLLGTSVGLYVGRPGAFARASVSSGDLRDDWVTALAVRGRDVFVGTYARGVTRLSYGQGGRRVASHLGGGYVNPAGLTVARGQLLAATMDGLLVRDLSAADAAWRPLPRVTLGRDVTQVVATGERAWVASRRGLTVVPWSLTEHAPAR